MCANDKQTVSVCVCVCVCVCVAKEVMVGLSIRQWDSCCSCIAVAIYITAQHEPLFLLSLSFASSSVFDGTRHNMCTVVTFLGPDEKLYSANMLPVANNKQTVGQIQVLTRMYLANRTGFYMISSRN